MADTETVTKAPGKAGEFVKKHKNALIVGSVVLVLAILYMIHRANQQNAAATSSNNTGTGYSPADLASILSSLPPGPAGPPGPEGPRGPKGPQGPGDGDGGGHHHHHHHKGKRQVNVDQGPHPAIQLSRRTSFHTVQPGETTTTVAARHGMTPSTLVGMNGSRIGGSQQVMPGQRVRVK